MPQELPAQRTLALVAPHLCGLQLHEPPASALAQVVVVQGRGERPRRTEFELACSRAFISPLKVVEGDTARTRLPEAEVTPETVDRGDLRRDQ